MPLTSHYLFRGGGGGGDNPHTWHCDWLHDVPWVTLTFLVQGEETSVAHVRAGWFVGGGWDRLSAWSLPAVRTCFLGQETKKPSSGIRMSSVLSGRAIYVLWPKKYCCIRSVVCIAAAFAVLIDFGVGGGGGFFWGEGGLRGSVWLLIFFLLAALLAKKNRKQTWLLTFKAIRMPKIRTLFLSSPY